MKNVIIVLLGALILGCTQKLANKYVIVKTHKNILIYHTPKEITYFTYKPVIKENGKIVKGEVINKQFSNHAMSNGAVLKFDKEGRHFQTNLFTQGNTIDFEQRKWEFLNGNKVKYTSSFYPFKEADYLDIEKYNNQGNLIYESSFCPACFNKNVRIKPDDETFYEYDDIGNLTKKRKYNFDYGINYNKPVKIVDSVITNYTPEYKNGKLFKHLGFTFIYKNDTLEKKIEDSGMYQEFYTNGISKKNYFFKDRYAELNKDGYPILSRLSKTHIMTYAYDRVDKFGNWTRVIVKENGKPVLYGERTLTYYN